jgi:sugar O-acyltransferase (sialic acid O-acetyltransferase NeuD family)
MTLKTYLYGGGGHAKVILDILSKQNRLVDGIGDDSITQGLTQIHGVPVERTAAILARYKTDEILWIVAIGNNQARHAVVDRLSQKGYQFTTAVHPSAQIALGVNILPGTVVMANAVINTDAQIGHHAIINTAATIDHDCVIGDYVHIAPGCSLCGQVMVRTGALLGVGTKVKPAMEIGAWTTCGAGSIVVKSLPPHVVAYGCPARIVHSQSSIYHESHAS